MAITYIQTPGEEALATIIGSFNWWGRILTSSALEMRCPIDCPSCPAPNLQPRSITAYMQYTVCYNGPVKVPQNTTALLIFSLTSPVLAPERVGGGYYLTDSVPLVR